MSNPVHSRSYPIVCLAGPTAIGKTAIALALVERVPIEIVSVDSAAVYRDMDIGTAKPSPAERAAVRHHLIDQITPDQPYSAGQFVMEARAAIRDCLARGRQPLLVGGTMLYYQVLCYGVAALPRADVAYRQTLAAQAEALGWPALHAQLAQIDPEYAARIHPQDQQRIQRALEVYHLTGTPFSAWHQQWPDSEKANQKLSGQTSSSQTPSSDRAALLSGVSSDQTPSSDRTLLSDQVLSDQGLSDQTFTWRRVALLPTDRAVLHARIEQRLNQQFSAGWVDEVRQLQQHYALTADLPSMRCVGYRQIWQYLAGEYDEAEMRYRVLVATRQLAKRQLTWLRRWVNAGCLRMEIDPSTTCASLAADQLTVLCYGDRAVS